MGLLDQIRTERLLLRPWRESDLETFAEMNADRRVMEFFPATMSRDESDAGAARIRAHFEAQGFGLWAVELPDRAPFIGFTGLATPRFEAHFTPCVEIGWRLSFAFWGFGYATEAARAALTFGFDGLGLREIVSFTAISNVRSRHVMEKIGMKRDLAGDFDHPLVPEGHPHRPHVLYRTSRAG
jgi:RimJ/RimL family protein N-acetyltransferase